MAEDVAGRAAEAFHRAVVGGQLRFALRLHRNVGWAGVEEPSLETATT
ncbi:MAG: hypothetical protein AAF799_16445 [Myxococcota bacterium]